jgi:hypothetical protein
MTRSNKGGPMAAKKKAVKRATKKVAKKKK